MLLISFCNSIQRDSDPPDQFSRIAEEAGLLQHLVEFVRRRRRYLSVEVHLLPLLCRLNENGLGLLQEVDLIYLVVGDKLGLRSNNGVSVLSVHLPVARIARERRGLRDELGYRVPDEASEGPDAGAGKSSERSADEEPDRPSDRRTSSSQFSW